MPASRGRPAERMLWLAGFVMVVLAPLALVAVAVKPGAQGTAVVFAAAWGSPVSPCLPLAAGDPAGPC